MSIDLHVHSTLSDGSLTPEELVRLASRKGLEAIAITDHDEIGAYDRAVTCIEECNIQVVSGVEFSVTYKNAHLHMLGYLFDPDHPRMQETLLKLQAGRKKRNYEIIEALNGFGCNLSIEQLDEQAGEGQAGRPHIARLLVKSGVVRSLDEAFADYLGRGQKAYRSRVMLEVDETIDVIHAAGGLAVLAHPRQVSNEIPYLAQLFRELVALGLDGVEVYYPTHKRNFRKQLLVLAERYGLLATGGSDYHGAIRPGTTLAGGKNVSVPLHLLDEMRRKVARNNRIAG